MSERDKILTACGWWRDEELPLIAERIINHYVEKIERLTSGLKKANQNHELFERRWYLAKDEIDRLQARVKALEGDARKTLNKAVFRLRDFDKAAATEQGEKDE